MWQDPSVFKWCFKAMAVVLAVAFGSRAFAGGSGLNVVVVVNQNSTNSVQLGNYYCEQRGVPPQNVLRINWTGGNIVWTRAEMDSVLRTPLNSMLASRSISNQTEYVLLSMDIPYRVTNTVGTVHNDFNGTTSALFYGFKDNPADTFTTCTLANGSTNAYAGSESIYRATPPINSASNSWLAIMLTATNLGAAKAIVDRGAVSDATFPTQTVYLAKTYDVNRTVRYVLFDDAVFDTRIRGDYSMRPTNTYTSSGLGSPLLGFQNGVEQYNLWETDFVPGAMVDNLTSFSGFLLEASGHTGVMDFLNAGATASFGTVTEPCAYLEKFATPRNYFYQSRGFNIAECYYQSLTNPYLGVLVGEPLAAPFAMPATGAWTGLPNDVLLAGTTNLTLQFSAASQSRPVQQVDLFVDGLFVQTLTNLPPRTNNILYVTLNGFLTNYTVPANASLKSVASNLTLRLNTTTYSNATKVAAVAHGDRVELRSLNAALAGGNVTLAVSNYIGTASVRTVGLIASRSNFLDTIAFG
ncbi:MAG: TIGR03790 family protein, partial [Akkermansiaceae bacterium]|nr:TIGR03790 family protein [Verrucomicrobiales bacterium]